MQNKIAMTLIAIVATGPAFAQDNSSSLSSTGTNNSGFENIIFQSLLLNDTGISIHQEGDRNEVVHTGTSTDQASRSSNRDLG